MNHYLLVYNRSAGALVESPTEYKDRALGLQARFARERRERADPQIEVVLISAKSKSDLEITHGRYFKSAAALVQR